MQKTKEEIRKKWQELVNEYDKRRIKSYEFCKINKVSRASIYKWRKYFSDNGGIGVEQKSRNQIEASTNCPSREAIAYTNLEEEGGFISLRIESGTGNKTEELYNKQEKAVSKYDEQISDKQVGKITSLSIASKNLPRVAKKTLPVKCIVINHFSPP